MAGVTLFACVNLKHINQFAAQSLSATAKFDEVPYSFSQHCIDRCEINAIDSFKIYRELDCHCEKYQKADRVTRLILHAIMNYLTGLEKLSNNEIIDYQLGPLAEALREEDLGPIQLKKEEADAYQALTDLLVRGVTVPYRQNRIKDYISDANAPLQVLLTKLQFIESKNLAGMLEFRKERSYDHYRGLLKSKLSDYERQKATADYYETLKENLRLEKETKAYSNMLKAIAAGHQKLYDDRNKISAPDTRRNLLPLVNDIRMLISEFNKSKEN